MSHYIGYYGKIIVREEFYGIIENGLDLTGTTDPIFMLYENLEDKDRFDKGFGNLIEKLEELSTKQEDQERILAALTSNKSTSLYRY